MPYKDVKDLYIIGDVTDLIAALDESLVTVTAESSTQFTFGAAVTAGMAALDAERREIQFQDAAGEGGRRRCREWRCREQRRGALRGPGDALP